METTYIKYIISNSTDEKIWRGASKELAALEAERDEWKKRAFHAAHIKEDDKVGFDWNVLAQIELLEAVAEAARTGKGLDDALDAQKKEVSNE